MKFIRICGIPPTTQLCDLEELFLEVIGPYLVSNKEFTVHEGELCFLYDFSLQAKKALPKIILLEIANFFERPERESSIEKAFVTAIRMSIKKAYPGYKVGLTINGAKSAVYYRPE